jgi:large subunit ribosomal protein L9
MEVVLLKDVETLGSAGAVVRVKPGFARNHLLPSGLAVAATPQQLKAVELAGRRREQQARRIQAGVEALKRRIESLSLTLTLTLGEDDRAFGSVTVHDIVEALAREGIAVEKPMVHLEQPLKALGLYEVPIRLHPQVAATVKVRVAKA